MSDDPFDPIDATWIVPKKVTWCAKCQDDAEMCNCGRDVDPGALIALVVVFSIFLIVAAAVWLSIT